MTGCDWCRDHDVATEAGPGARVSVVVSHFEQHDDLARTLAALARQTRPPHEVVVTDDGSVVPPHVPDGVRLLTQPDRGFRVALARNRAVAATTGDVLVLLDADTAPEPDYLARVARLPALEPDVLVVGRRRHTAYDPNPLDPADPLRGAEAHELEEPAWLREGWVASDGLRRDDEGDFRFVISAVMSCSRAWFDRVGGFDETFDRYGGEDWDLAHRWWSAGGRLRHEPDAVAWHHGPHAGDGERRLDPTHPRRTGEALTMARHVAATPVGFRGLRAAPARVLVTHDHDLDDRELVIAVDGVLRDLPQADVVSDRPLWARLGDHRVRPRAGTWGPRALLRLHLHRGLVAEPGGWARLFDLDRAGATTLVVHEGGAPVVSVTDLRRLRRDHLGLSGSTAVAADLPAGLRSAREVSLGAWLGGWA